MKNLLFVLAFAIHGISVQAQSQEPVFWSAVYEAKNEKEGEIIITGTLQKDWHTYSSRPTDAGPIPTSVTFKASKEYSLEGKLTETGAKEELDPAFDAKLYVFHEKAEFRQKVRLKSAGAAKVGISIEYMACNNMMCLPPRTVTLEVKLQK
jgi:DsbC/DsbD-like thiol-disulfide interchange protein